MGVPTVRKVQRTTVLEEKLQTLTWDAIPSKLHAIRCDSIEVNHIHTKTSISDATSNSNGYGGKKTSHLLHLPLIWILWKNCVVSAVITASNRCLAEVEGGASCQTERGGQWNWYATHQHTGTLAIKIRCAFRLMILWQRDQCRSGGFVGFLYFLRNDQFKTDQKNIFLGSFWCSFWAKTNTAF